MNFLELDWPIMSFQKSPTINFLLLEHLSNPVCSFLEPFRDQLLGCLEIIIHFLGLLFFQQLRLLNFDPLASSFNLPLGEPLRLSCVLLMWMHHLGLN
jgi:hypothetical protein